jgi:hypothetical protein
MVEDGEEDRASSELNFEALENPVGDESNTQ